MSEQRHTDFLLHDLCLYWDAILILFFRSSSDCKSLIVKGNLPILLLGGSAPGMMGYMCEYSVKRSLFSAGTNVIPSHRYFICISASMQYELIIKLVL